MPSMNYDDVYMYDTIRRINSDVEHMYGPNRFSVLCRCLTNKFKMRVLSKLCVSFTASGLEIPYPAPSTKYHLYRSEPHAYSII
jgi:hypothetical protein